MIGSHNAVILATFSYNNDYEKTEKNKHKNSKWPWTILKLQGYICRNNKQYIVSQNNWFFFFVFEY